jgi:hypothetical protein
MTDRVITLKIPEELAADAEQLGLLSRDRVIAWLQTEIKRHIPVTGDEPAVDEATRQAALQCLQEAAVKLRALESALTPDEIEEEIRRARNTRSP